MVEEVEADEELFTAAELSRKTGAAQTTFMNWTRRNPALATVTTPDGAVRFTRRDVLAFCAANHRLGAAAKVQRALRQPTEPPRTAATTEATPEVETLRASARYLRNAAHQNLQAVLTAARHAEETARSHREQLAASFASYDAALTQLTAPSTMND